MILICNIHFKRMHPIFMTMLIAPLDIWRLRSTNFEIYMWERKTNTKSANNSLTAIRFYLCFKILLLSICLVTDSCISRACVHQTHHDSPHRRRHEKRTCSLDATDVAIIFTSRMLTSFKSNGEFVPCIWPNFGIH